MKRILVTGGFGFIGGHLIERLLADPNNHVTVVDDLSTAPLPYKTLLDELGHPSNLTYYLVQLDDSWRRPDTIFDEIYHLASPVGPAGILPHAGRMVQQIVEDTYHLIELALLCGAKLLDVSTSEVYGGGNKGHCAEDMPRIIQAETTVRLEYAVAKLAAETTIINNCRTRGLNAVIVRPFNVAGRRQSGKGGFVLPRFVEQAMKNETITVFGDGTQVRAFTHVTDIVDGLVRAMARGRAGEVYNLGNPQNVTTVLHLARCVQAEIGSGHIQFVDPTTIYGELYAEAADKYPDATKAMTALGWQPEIGLRETILDVWGYMKLGILR
jgi:UDP-glucose 4-epimerase